MHTMFGHGLLWETLPRRLLLPDGSQRYHALHAGWEQLDAYRGYVCIVLGFFLLAISTWRGCKTIAGICTAALEQKDI
jgi:hypothetical protein